jgi:hypothetical protein
MTAMQSSRRQLVLKTVKVAAILVAIGVGMALVLASPLLLQRVAGGVSWTRLSEISATYAAASAILSAFGVGAVAIALFVQTRQAKAERINAVRAVHRELTMETLSQMEAYAPCWGPIDLGISGRRQLFTVQLLNYYWQGYDVDVISESALRHEVLPILFAGEVGRNFWRRARPFWEADPSSKGKRFFRIVDQEFAKACALGPPVPSPANDKSNPQMLARVRANPKNWLRARLLSFAGGLFLGLTLGRSKHR